MPLLRSHLRALALASPPPHSPSPAVSRLLIGGHLLALLAVWRLAHWPLWLAPAVLAAFALAAYVGGRWRAEALTPLIVLYGLAGVRLGIVYGLRQEVPAPLSYAWALGLSAAWAGLIGLRALGRLRYVWGLLGAAAAMLMAYLLLLNRPAGVTGSDPSAYVMMGLDLAQHGTPRHLFPLAPLAASLGLPTLPTVHVGYVLPDSAGRAPTVWPPGYSALLALAYRVGGEQAMLSLNVGIGLLGLSLTLGLTALTGPRRWRRLPLFAGLGALTLVATSPEQLTRLIVPLADGAAQALTSLTVILALAAIRWPGTSARRAILWGTLAGLALAAAYSVRYTQALIGPGIALMAWLGLPAQHRPRFLLAFALAALAGSAPDAWHRTQLYGAPWRFGTGELALFSLSAVPEAMGRLSAELWSRREFGWLWPLTVTGAVYLWRRSRLALLGLAAAYGPLVAFHLGYPFLRLRDLLSLYPVLAALSAFGGAALIVALWRRSLGVRLALVAALFALGLFRLAPALGLRQGFFTFGYLRAEQRQSLETLAVQTEPKAVIACSLNSGAVELYGFRQTVRPGNLLQPGLGWSADEWLRFVAALRAQGRPVYLLMDSPEMEAPLSSVQARYATTRVAMLDVPVYYVGGGSLNLRVPLYRVEP